VHGAAVHGPQAAEDAEEGRLAAPVGADDQKVVALLEGEGESWDKDVAVGGDDGTDCALGACGVAGAWKTGRATYTSMNLMSWLSTTLPLPRNTASLVSVPELETSFFSKCPAWTSSITSRSDDTRDVYPASSMISLYENMMRPNASDAERSILRLVTKLSVRSPMFIATWPGSLIKTGKLQSIKPSAPQKYLITKSSMKP
jgi:hypothetical protein